MNNAKILMKIKLRDGSEESLALFERTDISFVFQSNDRKDIIHYYSDKSLKYIYSHRQFGKGVILKKSFIDNKYVYSHIDKGSIEDVNLSEPTSFKDIQKRLKDFSFEI